MKKFLIGVLAMIPVIVVLALSATGSLIALTTPVNPESIELRGEDNREIEGPIRVELNGTEQFIIVNVLPAIAYSHEIEYEFDEEYGEGRVELERIDESSRYRIVPVTSGVARMTIRAKANFNAYASLTFIVASEVIREMSIYDEEGRTVSETLKPFAPMQLYCDIYPIDALNGSDVRWESTDPAVVNVSKNGLITPLSKGFATVTVSARDKKNVRHTASVDIDTEGALVSAVQAYTTEEPSAQWVKDNVCLSASASVREGGEGRFFVSEGEKTIEVGVKCVTEDEFGFVDGVSVIYKDNGPVFVHVARYSDKQEVQAVLSTSDPGILQVVSDELIAVSAGKATLIAAYAGKTVEKEILVKERPLTFDLNLTSADGKLGIGMTRVWGTEWYDGATDSFTNEYQFGSPDWNGENFDLLWSSSDPENFAVDQTGKIVFSAEARGKEGTISATVLVNNRRTNVTRSFTFRMLEEQGGVNVSDYVSLQRLAAEHQDRISVFQSNIVPDSIVGYNTVVCARGIYGNGFMLDFGRATDRTNWMTIIEIIGSKQQNVLAEGESVKIVDIQIRGAYKYEDCKNVGHGIYASDIENPILIKNLIVYNVTNGIWVSQSKDVTIEGCIIGDVWYTGISASNNPNGDASQYHLTLINNVFKASLGPAFLAASNKWGKEYVDMQIMPTTTIKGFMDVYNWKPPSETKRIMTELDPALFEALKDYIEPSKLTDLIGQIFDLILDTEAYKPNFYYDKKGDPWICLGGFALGTLLRVDPSKITIEDDRLTLLRFPLNSNDLDGLAQSLSATIEILMSTQGMKLTNDCYLVSYDFSNGDPGIKPGDEVPQNRELYERLNQGVFEEENSEAEA